ncbi:hypothetical protein [Protaetiibacter mangrovi]|uniref:Uncharacterized protein n=1 Tax=Protaetiibacter mangrovi TaxID=2970926 RepID=A0ABT1ZI33_9MICO|nr:hypothetical protein [Protaetiibacter mangrovi]MCS0500352.1 hypothetical protein [Protaetiibacter mangrovi]TPX02657.1 hypothetical protein FJ656_21215 [Schumannella luteola]
MSGLDALSLSLDRSWWPLGDGGDPIEAVLDVLIENLAPDLAPAEERGLRASLAVHAEWARSLPAGERSSFALVRDPSTARADALLSWRFGEAPSGAYDELLASARSRTSTDQVELVRPTTVETTVPAGRAIVIHDIAYTRTPGVQRPARERCIVAVFPTDSDALLELTASTIELSLFDDLPDYLLRIAAGEELGVPGYRESVGGGTP